MENKDQVLNTELLASVSKNITIAISQDDFETLKDGGYNLCIAKKVNDSFNVVWKSSGTYLMMNTFSYTAHYQLFGANVFQGGVTVRASTINQNCDLGQTCLLTANGVLKPAVDGGSTTALHFDNEYGPIHAGVNQILTGIDGRVESLPIYVGERQQVVGLNDLTPKESVLVWFEQDIETSTMFSTSRSNAIEVDLTNQNSIECLYKNGRWSIS